MTKKRHSREILSAIPFVVFAAGLAMLIWAKDITYHYIMLRRSGTLKLTAISLAEFYQGDTRMAGFCCVGAALLWWILVQKLRK